MRARNYNLGSTFAADATTLDVLSANVTLGYFRVARYKTLADQILPSLTFRLLQVFH